MSIAYDPAPSAPDAEPVFPPLLRGEAAPPGADPLARATARAASGVEAGTIVWSPRLDVLDVAAVLAPETSLKKAQAMHYAMALGLGDALGALAPPEVAVMWRWPDGVLINGARAGALRMEASGRTPDAEPDWLVTAVTLQIAPFGEDPGRRPDVTSLWDEGCADLTRLRLLESWSRHFLSWIHRWDEDGFRPLHDAWRGRAEGLGETMRVAHAGREREGVFVGLDEEGDLLLRDDATTHALPLLAMMDHPAAWPPAEALA